MNRSDEIRCETCGFVHARVETTSGRYVSTPTTVPDQYDKFVQLSCRRHPPTGSAPVWPNVNPTDWCGEWLPVSILNKRVPRKR